LPSYREDSDIFGVGRVSISGVFVMEIDPGLIARIVREEIRKYLKEKGAAGTCGAPPPAPETSGEVLAIFLGTGRGLEYSLAALRNLSASGVKVTAYFSQSALSVIDKEKVLRDGNISDVVETLPWNTIAQWVNSFQMIVVPSLTRNTAAKVALGISDNDVTQTLLVALGNKIPVVAGNNGMIPDPATDCASCALEVPNIGPILEGYQRVLESFGMVVVSAKQLDAEIQAILPSGGSAGEKISDNVITEEDALKIRGPRIVISSRTVLTPSARDRLNERGVEIVIEE